MENWNTLPMPRRVDRLSHRSLTGPLLLVAAGGLLLAHNFGLLGADYWQNLWRLWPLLLVLAGIDLFFKGRGWTVGIAVGLLVIIGVVLGSVFVMTVQYLPVSARFAPVSSQAVVVERVAEPVGGATRATIDLRHDAGKLILAALEDSEQLIVAELTHPEQTTFDRRIERHGDGVEVRLQDENGIVPLIVGNSTNEWAIKLSQRVPIDLRVSSGASDLELNLRDLLVTRLDVQVGATKARLTLPERAGQVAAQVRAGVGGVEVTVPDGVAARIHPKGGLNRVVVDQTRFPKVGEYYESRDYATATNRADLELNTGVGEVTIH